MLAHGSMHMCACVLFAGLVVVICLRAMDFCACLCVCVCARLCVFVCLLPLCLFSKVQQRGSSDQHHLTDGGGERFPWQPGALVSGGGWSVQPWELCHQHKLVCQRHHLHVQTRCSITMSSALLPFKFLTAHYSDCLCIAATGVLVLCIYWLQRKDYSFRTVHLPSASITSN